jgi:hypothetical protein
VNLKEFQARSSNGITCTLQILRRYQWPTSPGLQTIALSHRSHSLCPDVALVHAVFRTFLSIVPVAPESGDRTVLLLPLACCREELLSLPYVIVLTTSELTRGNAVIAHRISRVLLHLVLLTPEICQHRDQVLRVRGGSSAWLGELLSELAAFHTLLVLHTHISQGSCRNCSHQSLLVSTGAYYSVLLLAPP